MLALRSVGGGICHPPLFRCSQLSKKILVTGSTGATGREVSKLLKARGHEVRVLVHKKDDRSQAMADSGFEVMAGNLLDLNSVATALEGTDRAYFCFPIQPGVIEATANFAEAAREVGLKAIVNMSQMPARRQATSHASQAHWVAQGIFDHCGVNVTHIRPTFFAEWYLYLAHTIKEGVLRLPLYKEGRHAPIAAEDMAQVIANILSAPETHAGKSYDLAGPKAYNQLEIAELIGTTIGRPVKYEQVDSALYVSDVAKGGVYSKNTPPPEKARIIGDFLVQHLDSVKLEHRDGLLAQTNDIVARIGGNKALDLEQYIKKHIRAFQN